MLTCIIDSYDNLVSKDLSSMHLYERGMCTLQKGNVKFKRESLTNAQWSNGNMYHYSAKCNMQIVTKHFT